jgi:hypothetical protein
MLEKTPSKSLEGGEIVAKLLPDLPGTRATLQLARAIYSCLKYSWTIEKWPLILQIVSGAFNQTAGSDPALCQSPLVGP